MLRTLTFGDLDAGIWGAIWDPGAGGPRFALLGASADDEAISVDASIDGSEADASWSISGSGIELEASPEGEPGQLDGGFEQLIRLRGELTIDGSARDVELLGRRGVRDQIDPGRFEEVRDVSAWFGPDLAMALVAARPRGATGHVDDVVSACVLEDGRSLPVADPRLSTTYAGSGAPIRASLELWLERPAEDDEPKHDEDEPVRRFPRRAAGESMGARGDASDGLLTARAGLFRWHSRGREGTGVYVLARLAEA